MKLPPLGRALSVRLQHGNIPRLVHVMVGDNAWNRARMKEATSGGCHAMIWDGDSYRWPVAGCCVRVEISGGPTIDQCLDFARMLISYRAVGVILWWLDRDEGLPRIFWPDGTHAELELCDLRALLGVDVDGDEE